MATDGGHRDQGPGNVADPYRDLLSRLDERRRRGLVHRLALGYYDGWRRPTPDEIARETGQISEAEYLARRRPPTRPPEQRQGRPVNPSALAARRSRYFPEQARELVERARESHPPPTTTAPPTSPTG